MTTRMTTTSTPRNALTQARTPLEFRVTGVVRPYAEHSGFLTGLCPPDLANLLSKYAPIRSPGLQSGAFTLPSPRQTPP